MSEAPSHDRVWTQSWVARVNHSGQGSDTGWHVPPNRCGDMSCRDTVAWGQQYLVDKTVVWGQCSSAVVETLPGTKSRVRAWGAKITPSLSLPGHHC